MSETANTDVREAQQFVACLKEASNGAGLAYASDGNILRDSWKDGDYLRRLERRLAKLGETRYAREVRLRRNHLDKERAETIISGSQAEPVEILRLAKRLADNKLLGLARRVLELHLDELSETINADVFVEYYQKTALYTYKDPDLPLEWRLDEALKILERHDNLATTSNRETLGIAGAIHKRKWEVDGQRKHLGRSLSFYMRGYAHGLQQQHVDLDEGKQNRPSPSGKQHPIDVIRADVLSYLRDNPTCVLAADDQGYNGINAAFILDLLARLDEEEMGMAGATSAEQRREGARNIRAEIVRSVPEATALPGCEWMNDEWWLYATIGEAYFGLGDYAEAIKWLVDKPKERGLTIKLGAEPPSGLEVPEWEYESTARQLARIARLQNHPLTSESAFTQTDAGRALIEFLGQNTKAVESAFRGKFGLGLSGGGFRASLFHIGVLARLAELDVLRHVEVISCVSGGSIIGAHYYLELRKLLQSKSDDEISQSDYIELVQRVERDFLAGVQKNVRTRIAAELITNLKMIFTGGYSRTMRLGELYESEIFSRVQDGEGNAPRMLNELFIFPAIGEGKGERDFNPRNHNWRRANKVPALVLNAAALNTGHNWQFTASFMGEPPTAINRAIDSNYRLRRMYYKDAPKQYQQFRLGYAVAASSCVPGLFEPLLLDDLYPDDNDESDQKRLISVRLIDGGACDNQGIASLLEQDCNVMLVSDASGQMDSVNVPGKSPLGVLLRTTSVVQSRVREAQFVDIASRRRSSLLRGLMFIHLRQDLPGSNIAWKECPSGLKESEFETSRAKSDSTTYNVSSTIQQRLSAIRTDLDSFNDAEAFALMASAYRMTEAQFKRKCIEGFPEPQERANWRFLQVEDAMRHRSSRGGDERRKHLEELLEAGSSVAFKAWKLSPMLRVVKYALLGLITVAILVLFRTFWGDSIVPAWLAAYLTFRNIALLIGTLAAIWIIGFILNATLGAKNAKTILYFIQWQDTLRMIIVGVAASTFGVLAARLHLHVFDPIYLRLGKLERFPK